MNRFSVVAMIFGVVLLLVLLFMQDTQQLLALLLHAGPGLLCLPVVWFPALLMMSESWRMVFPNGDRPLFSCALAASWVGRSVNTLLPVANIGGEFAKLRLIVLRGGVGECVAATVVVDKTVQVLAVIFWGLLGLALLFASRLDTAFAYALLPGLGILTLGTIGFFLIQRGGMFSLLARLARLFSKQSFFDADNARAIDQMVMAIYRSGRRFYGAVSLKTLALVVQTGEVWVACWLLGHPIGLLEAMVLKSLTATVVDCAFLVPNGYGVQEAAYIAVGAVLGLQPELALAVSLSVRLRELVIDVPGLVYWQHIEGRALWHRRASL